MGRFVPGSCTVICEKHHKHHKHNHQSLPVCHMSQPGTSESPASRPAAGGDGIGDSVFVVDPDAPVYDMPMSAISRPIPSVLDEAKVQDFTCKLQVRCVQYACALVSPSASPATLAAWADTAHQQLSCSQLPHSWQEGTKLTPIEVAWVEHEGKNYYFAFGSCHR